MSVMGPEMKSSKLRKQEKMLQKKAECEKQRLKELEAKNAELFVFATNGTLKLTDIPVFLREGYLCQNLFNSDNDADETFEFPFDARYRKYDCTVNGFQDLGFFFHTWFYWQMSDQVLPIEVFRFCLEKSAINISKIMDILDLFKVQMSSFKDGAFLKRLIKTDTISSQIELTAEHGRTDILQLLLNSQPKAVVNDWYGYGTSWYGFCDWEQCRFTAAAAKCTVNYDCLMFLSTSKCRVDYTALKVVACTGHLQCLKDLLSADSNTKESLDANFETVCVAAVSHGRVECLDYLLSNHKPLVDAWDNCKICCAAALKGHLNCLQLARGHGCLWDERTTKSASHGGSLECLVYLHDNGCPWDVETVIAAAGAGHLNCLQYAHETEFNVQKGHSADHRVCDAAAAGGHLVTLKYAHEVARHPFNQSIDALPENEFHHANAYERIDGTTAAIAAQHGHLDCLMYAVENGCVTGISRAAQGRWFASLCSNDKAEKVKDCFRYLCSFVSSPLATGGCEYSAHVNDLTYLKLLLECGCVCGVATVIEAARFADVAFMQYLLQHTETCAAIDEQDQRVLLLVSLDNILNPDMFRLVYEHWSPTLDAALFAAAAGKGSSAVHLEFMLANGSFRPDGAAYIEAAKHNKVTNLRFLHEIMQSHCQWDEATTAAALESGSLECLKYAVENRCPLTVRSIEAFLYEYYSDFLGVDAATDSNMRRAYSSAHGDCVFYCLQRNVHIPLSLVTIRDNGTEASSVFCMPRYFQACDKDSTKTITIRHVCNFREVPKSAVCRGTA